MSSSQQAVQLKLHLANSEILLVFAIIGGTLVVSWILRNQTLEELADKRNKQRLTSEILKHLDNKGIL